MGDQETMPINDEQGYIRLGLILRDLRLQKKLSGSELGRMVRMSQSKISKIETGSFRAVSLYDIQSLLEALEPDEEIRRQVLTQFEIASMSPLSIRYIEAHGVGRKQREIRMREQHVKIKRVYSPCLIPGLLQIPNYISALFTGLGVPSHKVSFVTAERLRRQEILGQHGRQFAFIVNHAALYTSPGGKSTQIDQLRHLIKVSRFPNIRMGIVPVTAGLPLNADNGFALMDDAYATGETVLAEQQSFDSKEIAVYFKLYRELEALSVFDHKAEELITSVINNLMN